MIDRSIFKAYDIRGVYPSQLDENTAYDLGRAFATMRQRELNKQEIKLAVGWDMRLSSLGLRKALVRGLLEQGATVVELGLVATPTFYFAVGKLELDGGIQVSASHNPKEYNGFKMVREQAIPVSGDTGIQDLADMMEKEQFAAVANLGKLEKQTGMLDAEVDFALAQVDLEKLKPLKIVADTANGMGGPLLQALFAKLSGELIPMNFALDGTFPAHEADPLKDENNRDLQKCVLAENADLGLAIDGDADRIFFVDNFGKTIEPAIVRGILSKIFLRQYPAAKICYDVRPGKITVDMIKEAGGEPVVTRVGHSLIKEKARAVSAVFAGESSGHFFLQTPYGFFEEPLTMILKLWQELSESGLSAADYIKPLRKYFHSGEINRAVADKEAVFTKLRNAYGAHLQYDFDGLSFDFGDWWFNVRASNTENKIRLNLESISAELTAEKTQEVLTLIG